MASSSFFPGRVQTSCNFPEFLPFNLWCFFLSRFPIVSFYYIHMSTSFKFVRFLFLWLDYFHLFWIHFLSFLFESIIFLFLFFFLILRFSIFHPFRSDILFFFLFRTIFVLWNIFQIYFPSFTLFLFIFFLKLYSLFLSCFFLHSFLNL